MEEFNSGNNVPGNENSPVNENEVQVDNINGIENTFAEEQAAAAFENPQGQEVQQMAAEVTEETETTEAAQEQVQEYSTPAQAVPVQAEPTQADPAQAGPNRIGTPHAGAFQTGPAYPNGGYQGRPQPYYNESIKKTKGQKTGAGQLVLVSVLGALIGAILMFAATVFLSPVIQPAVNNFLGISKEASEVATGSDNGIYKKVEITQSASPVEAISEKVSPSIVGIKVTAQSQGSGFFFELPGNSDSEGSGIIIRADGYILTNNHVIESALGDNSNKISEGSKIEVILPSDIKRSYEAKVVGRDEKTDIAVLKIEATGLPAAELGDSDKVKSGELAVAIGNPGGIDYMGSVTAGIISGINRSIQMENGETLTLLQTDAAINPGNSGGALCNSQGQVIGINTVKIAATGYEGLGFAIPINTANDIAKSLIDYKYVKGRPYLGVSIDQRFNADVAKQYNVPNGLLVYDVLPLSAAYKAGVQAGDIITKFDGKAVTEFKELEDQKNKHKPGDKVEIQVYRDGKTLKLTATLDEEKNTD
jgi:serine protease Do